MRERELARACLSQEPFLRRWSFLTPGLSECLATVKLARAGGLSVPVVLMGYYNPFRAFGEETRRRVGVSSSEM